MKRILFASFIGLAFVFSTIQVVSAHHKGTVLSEVTSAAEITFPTVSYGPGHFLPDSKFYGLDKFWQKVKIAVAIRPETRVAVRTEIAGERLAELRAMVARNNQDGIETALAEYQKEVRNASRELAEYAASGKDMREVAAKTNDTLREQRHVFEALLAQSGGSLHAKFLAARLTVREAEFSVEEHLAKEALDREVAAETSDEMKLAAKEIIDSSKQAQVLLGKLADDETEVLGVHTSLIELSEHAEDLLESLAPHTEKKVQTDTTTEEAPEE